jgi:hypothetical protein
MYHHIYRSLPFLPLDFLFIAFIGPTLLCLCGLYLRRLALGKLISLDLGCKTLCELKGKLEHARKILSAHLNRLVYGFSSGSLI